MTGWVWLILLLEVGAIEWYLATHGHPTLSQQIWRWSARYPWFRWVVLFVMCLLTVHFVWRVLG